MIILSREINSLELSCSLDFYCGTLLLRKILILLADVLGTGSITQYWCHRDHVLVPITPAIREPGPSKISQQNIDIVGDKDEYRSVNFKSMIKNDAFNSLRTDFNISNDYIIIRSEPKDRIYKEVRAVKLYGMVISWTAFQCGLRVPIQAFFEKIVMQTGVTFARL